jgi:hypothetical protein
MGELPFKGETIDEVHQNILRDRDPLLMPKQIFNQAIYRQPFIQTFPEANIYPCKILPMLLSTGVFIQFL